MAAVLLATDGSDLAHRAIRAGVDLLGNGHRFLAVTVTPHAFAPAATVTPMDSHPVVLDPSLEVEIEEEDRAEGAAELASFLAELGVDAEQLVLTGDPGPVICEVAERRGVDLVVLGTHGHGFLKRVLMGSVSTHVLHHAPCPVMVMRHDRP